MPIVLPKFTKHPKSVTIRAGDVNKVAMSCKATGVGALQYHWEKYQPSSDSWMRPSRRAVDVTSRKLIFSVIEEEDEGIYHCVVTNDDGSVSSDNATINVYGEYTFYINIILKLFSYHSIIIMLFQLSKCNIYKSLAVISNTLKRQKGLGYSP